MHILWYFAQKCNKIQNSAQTACKYQIFFVSLHILFARFRVYEANSLYISIVNVSRCRVAACVMA